MVNYACAFSQSESGKYFERIINRYMYKNVMLCTFNSLVLIFGHFYIEIPMKIILEPQFKLQDYRYTII